MRNSEHKVRVNEPQQQPGVINRRDGIISNELPLALGQPNGNDDAESASPNARQNVEAKAEGRLEAMDVEENPVAADVEQEIPANQVNLHGDSAVNDEMRAHLEADQQSPGKLQEQHQPEPAVEYDGRYAVHLLTRW